MSDTFQSWWKSCRDEIEGWSARAIAKRAWLASAKQHRDVIERLRAKLIACKSHADCINQEVIDGLRDEKGA